MIKYRCPECGANCNTSHCYDCDIDIPMSQKFDSETESGPSKEYRPVPSTPYRDTSAGTACFKCPDCGAICQSAYCFTCEKDLPQQAKYFAPSTSSRGNVDALHYDKPTGFSYERKVSGYLTVDTFNKTFTIKHGGNHTFGDLVSFELYENNSVLQKGGVGRALVGGALFGSTGAIVGAATRKSHSVVDSLYIRLTCKSGMEKITFISSPTDRNGIFYKSIRNTCDEVMAELELILAEKQNAAAKNEAEQEATPPPPVQQSATVEQSPTLIADELLKLKQLLDMGVLTEEEFNQQKQKLLNK